MIQPIGQIQRTMRTSGSVMSIGLSDAMMYRFELLTGLIFSFFPVLIHYYLWTQVYRWGAVPETMADYTLGNMLTYYVIGLFVWRTISSAGVERVIAGEIRNGTMIAFLARPINRLWYQLLLHSSGKIVYAGVYLVPAAVAGLILHQHMTITVNPTVLCLFVVCVTLAVVLNFLLMFLIGSVAFFWTNVSSLYILINLAFDLAGGRFFPLDLLPGYVQTVLSWLPFPYISFFSIQVAMARVSPVEAVMGIGIQVLWCVILVAANALLWARGLRCWDGTGLT